MDIVTFADGGIRILDQTRLPHETAYVTCRTVEEVAEAIREMKVRGAPAIGVAAAYGMALSKDPEKAADVLKKARPTAADLSNAVDYVLAAMKAGKTALDAADGWHRTIRKNTAAISRHGASLIPDGARVLLHCNAGPLATAGSGTSLGAVLEAAKTKSISAYVDETRPRFQGALTSWELVQAGIAHRVIVDAAAGSFMRRGMVDLVMAGADRIAHNGDFANKIGTYPLAVVAKENCVPFYVLAPISTFDFSLGNGDGIVVEERNESEVLEISGRRVYGQGTKALNPAFDVTPVRYVTAYVTEKGICKAEELAGLWKNTQASSSK
jgi:translation initiation factor eIF-2B subunit alpha/methylthioribose-1-phosphate isomerase